MVLPEQIQALIDFVDSKPELALGYIARTSEGRTLSSKLWAECAEIVNKACQDQDCPRKSGTEWRLFFNEYKCRLLKKIKQYRDQLESSSGRRVKLISLTPLQKRLYVILQREGGDSFTQLCRKDLYNDSQGSFQESDTTVDTTNFASDFSSVENKPESNMKSETIEANLSINMKPAKRRKCTITNAIIEALKKQIVEQDIRHRVEKFETEMSHMHALHQMEIDHKSVMDKLREEKIRLKIELLKKQIRSDTDSEDDSS